MGGRLSERRVICLLTDALARRIASRVIRQLQRMTVTMSGDDSPLQTTWDEICVQCQYERDFHWSYYDETVRAMLSTELHKLSPHEREALWFQADAALDWQYEDPERRDDYPVNDNETVHWLAEAHIYPDAEMWSNVRIRKYLKY
jgi:IS4 transposase